jgi:nitric oxide reductase activation protein
VPLDRATDDEDDGNAMRAADDMEQLAITRDGQAGAARVKFDLDLPSASADDRPLGEGETLPEWDWKQQRLRADHCRVVTLLARPALPFAPAAALRVTARRVRRRLEVLRAAPRWQRHCADGEEIDLDAWVRHASDDVGHPAPRDPPVFARRTRGERSLATLLLADLSLSTDSHVNNESRVIDVIRDALYVFGEALAGTVDAFEMLGFSSVRRRLEVLRAAPRWQRHCADGEEIDLDAWVRHASEPMDHHAGHPAPRDPPVFARRTRGERSLATLLLADLSLSTDAHVNNESRVIDVIRDALYVFGEALDGTGDAFEMLGFSSVRRQHVRMQHLKGFDEAWSAAAQARVGAIKPGYYTRMGAALRLATRRLSQRPERQRLLLILTDGKPNDLDVYEGRWGIEDTRHAVHEARAAGLLPFCLSIDEEAHDYLPHLFGRGGWAQVRRPAELPARLASVYARLTR